MAGEGHQLSELAQLLAGADEGVLVAMANLGLVKRARKDLEREPPELVSRDDAAVVLRCEGFEVRLVAPLGKSTCTCPAQGICRHILTGILCAQAGVGEARPFDPAELLGVTVGRLEEWAGKKLVRQAEKLLAEHRLEATLDERGVLRVPSHHFECRWLPGGGLESLVCSCHASEPCLHRVVCLLAWLRQAGVVETPAAPPELQAGSGVVRTRPEVLASLGQVLAEMASLGTSRLASASAERLQTLSMSAHGVDLPRLARLLRSLESEIRAILGRQAQASTAGWLATAALTEALRSGLAGDDPPPGLVGTHKARFMEIPGSLELAGVGARRFLTRGGTAGLTVYFVDSSGGWATWMEGRRTAFDPLARYRQEGPWQGCGDPRRASRSVLRLAGVWKSPAGQLSGRSSTRALVLGPTAAERLPVIGFAEARARAAEVFAGGLADRPESARLVALAPASWEPARFDPIHQRLELTAYEEGELSLRLPFAPETRAAIQWLERTPLEGARVLGILQLTDELYVEPVTVYRGDEQVNLTLDLEDAPTVAPAVGAADDFEDEEEVPVQPEGTSAVSRLLSLVEGELEALAEAGTRSSRDVGALVAYAGRLETLGLDVCARRLRVLAEGRSEAGGGRELLRAAYVVGQQRRLAAVNERVSV